MATRWKSFLLLFFLLAILINITLALTNDITADNYNNITLFGEVNFNNSCSPTVNQTFQFGISSMYNFWFTPAEGAFEETIKKDPSCCIAYWGLAHSLYHPIWDFPTNRMEKGWDIIQFAVDCAKNSSAITLREESFIYSLAHFFEPRNTSNSHRLIDYANDLSEVYDQWGKEDPNAGIIYGLSLLGVGYYIDDSSEGYPWEKRAAAIEKVVEITNENNPGVLHYLIHSFDQPTLAEFGINAAEKYAKSAPAIPHALHMPSHIFVDLGRWEDAVNSNEKSMNLAYQLNNGLVDSDWQHAAMFITYAYLQMGMDEYAASLVFSYANNLIFKNSDDESAARCPCHYLIETRQWEIAAQFNAHTWISPPYYNWTDDSYSNIYSYFTQFTGRMKMNDYEGAIESYSNLLHAENNLPTEWKSTQLPYWRDSFTGLIKSATAWMMWMEDHNKGIEQMQEVVLYQSSTFQPEIGHLRSGREQLAEMFELEEDFESALRVYQEALKLRPNRFWLLWGAGSCADKLGDVDLAVYYFNLLVKLAVNDYQPPHLEGITYPSVYVKTYRTEVLYAQSYLLRHSY